MLNELSLKAYFAVKGAKDRFVNFLKSEKGGAEIIAVVLVIAIVLVLAGVFFDEIKAFFTSLWQNVVGKDPTGDMNKFDVDTGN